MRKLKKNLWMHGAFYVFVVDLELGLQLDIAIA